MPQKTPVLLPTPVRGGLRERRTSPTKSPAAARDGFLPRCPPRDGTDRRGAVSVAAVSRPHASSKAPPHTPFRGRGQTPPRGPGTHSLSAPPGGGVARGGCDLRPSSRRVHAARLVVLTPPHDWDLQQRDGAFLPGRRPRRTECGLHRGSDGRAPCRLVLRTTAPRSWRWGQAWASSSHRDKVPTVTHPSDKPGAASAHSPPTQVGTGSGTRQLQLEDQRPPHARGGGIEVLTPPYRWDLQRPDDAFLPGHRSCRTEYGLYQESMTGQRVYS